MRDELFDVPQTKSPKLRWTERHGIQVMHDPNFQHGDEDEQGNEKFRFYASDDNFRHQHGGDRLPRHCRRCNVVHEYEDA